MKISGSTCYSQILYCMSRKEFMDSINTVKLGQPDFMGEGMLGYIEVQYEFDIRNLSTFSEIWDSWITLTDERRNQFYRLAKGQGVCI